MSRFPWISNGERDAVVLLASGVPLSVARSDGKRNLPLIAERQHGRVATRQLLAAGISEQTLRTLTASGILVREHTGVYRFGGTTKEELARETAALLAAGEHALIVGVSALIVWKGLPPDGRRPVDVSVHPPQGHPPHSRKGIRVRRLRNLTSQHVRTYRGLRIASPERALLDSAGELTRMQLRDAADELIVVRATSRTKLRTFATGLPDTHPRKRLLTWVASRSTTQSTSKSVYQRKALRLIGDANLPAPETEIQMYGFTADFFFREAAVVFEVDGFRPHDEKERNFIRDRRKDATFRGQGLTVVRAAASDIDDRPLAVIADLARTIEKGLARRN